MDVRNAPGMSRPYSSAVRERLTELGLDFVAKQVAPRQEDRKAEHEIPLLVTNRGERFEGTDEVFAYLATLEPGEAEREHRAQYRAHRADRAYERTARVLTEKAPLGDATRAHRQLRRRDAAASLLAYGLIETNGYASGSASTIGCAVGVSATPRAR